MKRHGTTTGGTPETTDDQQRRLGMMRVQVDDFDWTGEPSPPATENIAPRRLKK